jgi:hypothetical protein
MPVCLGISAGKKLQGQPCRNVGLATHTFIYAFQEHVLGQPGAGFGG